MAIIKRLKRVQTYACCISFFMLFGAVFMPTLVTGQTPTDVPCTAPSITASNSPGVANFTAFSACCYATTNFLKKPAACSPSIVVNKDSWLKIDGMTAGQAYNYIYVETGDRQTYVEVYELPAGQDCSIPSNFINVACSRPNDVNVFSETPVSATFIPRNASSTYYLRFIRFNVGDDLLAGRITVVKSYSNDLPCGAIELIPQDAIGTNPTAGDNLTAADWRPDIVEGTTCGPNNDVWYTFVADNCLDKVYIKNLNKGVYEIQGGVFESIDGNCDQASLREIIKCGGANDTYDDITLSLTNLTIGRRYYVIVDGYSPPFINGIGHFTIEIIKAPGDCPNNDSPCSCEKTNNCAGTHYNNTNDGNAALNNFKNNPYGTGCADLTSVPLTGGNNLTEFCYQYKTAADEVLVAFDHVVNMPTTCEVYKTKEVMYKVGDCAHPIAPSCVDVNGKSSVFNVTPNQDYKFCFQVVTNAGDIDCIGNTFKSYCPILWKVPGAFTMNRTICQGQSYAFNGQNITSTGVYPTVFKSSKTGCDSSVVLNLTVTPTLRSTTNATTCAESPYYFGGISYNATGTYTQNLKNKVGCDSVATLNLTVRSKVENTLNRTICAGEQYNLGGSIYNNTGTFVKIFKDKNGCDSTVTLNLTVRGRIETTLVQTICAEERYSLGNASFSATGTYTKIFTSLLTGCDSTVTLVLTVRPPNTNNIAQTICGEQTYNFGGTDYNTTGTYTKVFKDKNGCDSTVTLTLNVRAKNQTNISRTVCGEQTYTFGSDVLDKSGTYTKIFKDKNGCDSTVTLQLTVPNRITSALNVGICTGQTYTLLGKVYDKAGTFTVVTKSLTGCDSTITLNLSVSPAIVATLPKTICAGESYAFGGNTYNKSGSYSALFKAKGNCDSIVNLVLTVSPPITSSISHTICFAATDTVGAQTFNKSGNYKIVLKSKNGCDSTVNLALTVSNKLTADITAAICRGENYYVGKNNVFSSTGNYTIVFTSKNGCDSTVNLALTAYNVDIAVTNTVAGCVGESKGTMTVSVTGDNAPFEASIDNGATFTPITGTSYSFKNLKAGNYNVVVKTAKGCTFRYNGDAKNTTITELKTFDAKLDSASVKKACFNQANGMVGVVVANGGVAPFSYTWSNGATGATITDKIGTYKVTVTDKNGCASLATVGIAQFDEIVVSVDPASKKPACYGQDNGKVAVVVTSGGLPPFTYTWSNGTKGVDKNSITGGKGTYKVTVTDKNACSSILNTVTIDELDKINVNAGKDTMIYINENAALHGAVSGGIAPLTFEWTPPTYINANTKTLNPVATAVKETITYTLTATDANGCKGTDDVVVNIKDGIIKYPKAFTPNDDGLNDTFEPFIKGAKVTLLRIYNRWGELIFDSDTEHKFSWDGTYKGEPQPVDVYVYYAEAIDEKKNTVQADKGNVTLLR